MHFFPARLRPVEPHVFVPLASVFAPRWWLRLWAHAGIRNNFQRGMSGDAVATENEIYLRTSTNYHTLREIEALAGRHFTTIRWVEQAMLEHAYGRARVLSPLARRTSMVSFVFRHFHTRVLATS
jgi:hypothetical protein